MTPEGKVKADVKRQLKKLRDEHGPRIKWVMPVAGRFGKKGQADFTLCVNGWYVEIETKANGGRPTDMQSGELDATTAANGIALVLDETNVKQLTRILTVILNDDRTEGLRLSWRRQTLRTSKSNHKKHGAQSKASGVERDRNWQDILSDLGS
jgi:hypothetical protein